MSRYTKDDIFRMVEEEDVEFIRLQFTDIFGTLKNIAITSSQLEKALDNKCMFDGSSVEGFVRIEESDMYLYPDTVISTESFYFLHIPVKKQFLFLMKAHLVYIIQIDFPVYQSQREIAVLLLDITP